MHLVEELGRRIVARQADVRDRAALQAAVDEAVATLGRLDRRRQRRHRGRDGRRRRGRDVDDLLDVNLTGVWNTVKAAAPR